MNTNQLLIYLLTANLKDLLATKLAVITQRIEYKDYIDITNILKSNNDLKEALKRAGEFYGHQFSIQETLRTMSYFKGGDLNRLKDEKNTLLQATQSFMESMPTHSIKPKISRR